MFEKKIHRTSYIYRLVIYIYIALIAFLFMISAHIALLMYRYIPLPSFLKTVGGSQLNEQVFFANSLARTPLRRNNNFIRIPIAIGVAIVRRFVPPLDNFLRNRRSEASRLDIDEPNVADMVIPHFDESVMNESTVDRNANMRLSMDNFMSLTIFFIIFLLSLLVVTRIAGLVINLFAKATRSFIKTTNEVRQLKSTDKKTNNDWLD